MEIEILKLKDIKEYENNAKLHPDWQVEQIAKSIKEFGFNDPIAINEHNQIIEGHGRYLACKLLNIKEVPCIRLVGLTDSQERAYILAHNKLTMNTDFDIEKLKYELNALNIDDFDLSLTGFTDYEIQEAINHLDIFDESEDVEEELTEEYEEPNKNIVCPHCGYTADKKEFKNDK